jgi:hypothetical protein
LWHHNPNRFWTLAFKKSIGGEMALHEANEGGQAKSHKGFG